MRNHKTRDISSNLDDISVRTPDVSQRAFDALESDAYNRRGSGIGPFAAHTKTATCSPETSDQTRALETPALQRLVDNRETILRVGPLQLDLIDRTAKRNKRVIDLLTQEFHLLKYMMQHSNQVLKRSTLLKEVWHYKVTPSTNLVDVHMGRLRRKVDGPNETRMIHNVRCRGFILQDLSDKRAESFSGA
jgi:DNA-binding winged helix-turn-helix (wHTH) protein